MGHLGELDGFDAACRDFLRDLYPGANIEYQAYLKRSGRFADFAVTREMPGDQPDVVYAVETEDDFSGVIKSIGQAELYAGHYPTGTPVLLFPEGHYQQPELSMLQEGTPVLLLRVPERYEPSEEGDDAS